MAAGALVDWPSLLPVVGFAKTATSLFSTIRAARAAGAMRLGLLGAVEGGITTAAESVQDPSIGTFDVFKGAAVGGAFGGTIGGIFPKAASVAARRHTSRRRCRRLLQCPSV